MADDPKRWRIPVAACLLGLALLALFYLLPPQ